MAEEIGLKIGIDAGDALQSVKELKAEIKATVNELAATEEGTEAYTMLAKKAALAKDKLEDLHENVAALKPGGEGLANTFAKMGQSIVGGFAAAQGAAALFGSEGKNVQEAILKIQASMALLEGFKAIQEGVKNFGQMRMAVQGVIGSLNLMKGAIMATGIGLLVVAIGTIAAKWDDIKVAMGGVSKEQTKLNQLARENRIVAEETLKALMNNENALRLSGKTEKEILQTKKEQTFEILKAYQLEILRQEQTMKSQLDKAREGAEKTVSIVSKILGSSNIGAGYGLADAFFDPGEIKQKGDEALTELRNKYAEALNIFNGYTLKINEIDNKAYEDEKKREEEQWAQRMETEALHNEERKTKREIEHEDRLIRSEEDKAFRDSQSMQELLDLTSHGEMLSEIEKANDKERLENRQKINDALVMSENATMSSLNSLAVLFINNSKKLQKAQKALAVAQLAMDTAKAISTTIANAATAASAGGPAAPYLMVAYIASGVAVVLANIVKAKQLLSKAGDGGADISLPSAVGGSAGGGAPTVNNPTTSGANLQTDANGNFTGQVTTQPIKAYVVETDITGSQKQVSSIEKKAQFE